MENKSEVSCSRTEHNEPGQGSNQTIQSRVITLTIRPQCLPMYLVGIFNRNILMLYSTMENLPMSFTSSVEDPAVSPEISSCTSYTAFNYSSNRNYIELTVFFVGRF